MSKKVDWNIVKQKLDEMNLILDEDFTILRKEYDMHDTEGYKYCIHLKNIMHSNNRPSRFYIGNKYSVENIRHYIELNKIECELLSEVYEDNKTKMDWKCKCGNVFKKSWSKFQSGQCQCQECADRAVQEAKYLSPEAVYTRLKEMNLDLIEDSFSSLSEGFDAYTEDGYKVRVNRNTFWKSGKPEIVHPLNPYSIENINYYLELERAGEYRCVSKTYEGNTVKMDFIHQKCGKVFKAGWYDMRVKKNYTGKRCPHCYESLNGIYHESTHAYVLKQIFRHEYPDTICEDKSCINPITGHILPTDIVNHFFKIAIEVQSGFHDDDYQKVKDSIKKKYWMDRGYRFFDPDIRDYTIIQMVQIFFPTIVELPSYIVNDNSEFMKYEEIQNTIDSNMYKGYQIAKMFNVSYTSLLYWDKQGKIKLR